MSEDQPATIYCDGVHLAAPGHEAALHRFARRIGLRRDWFQPHPRHPHYDVMGGAVDRAFAAGAVRVSPRELAKLFEALAAERAARAADKVVYLLQVRQERQAAQALQEAQAGQANATDIALFKSLVTDFEAKLCDKLVRKDGHPMDLESAQWLLKKFWRGPVSPWHTAKMERIFHCPFQEGDRIEFEGRRYLVARFRPETGLQLFLLNRDGNPSKVMPLDRDRREIENEKNWPRVTLLQAGDAR
jgi:AraC-like DNA-binding protein